MPHGPCNCAHKQIALAETKKKWKKQEYLKQMDENNNLLKMEKKRKDKNEHWTAWHYVKNIWPKSC